MTTCSKSSPTSVKSLAEILNVTVCCTLELETGRLFSPGNKRAWSATDGCQLADTLENAASEPIPEQTVRHS